jgi:hypothetical protein
MKRASCKLSEAQSKLAGQANTVPGIVSRHFFPRLSLFAFSCPAQPQPSRTYHTASLFRIDGFAICRCYSTCQWCSSCLARQPSCSICGQGRTSTRWSHWRYDDDDDDDAVVLCCLLDLWIDLMLWHCSTGGL